MKKWLQTPMLVAAVAVLMCVAARPANAQSTTKKEGSATKKGGSATKKEGSATKKEENATKKGGSATKKEGSGEKQGSAEKKAGSGKKEKEPTFEQRFWDWLERVKYKENFAPWPGMEDKFLPGESPHGPFLKLYVNQPVHRNPEDPPYKSVIVKENYKPVKKEAKPAAKGEEAKKKPASKEEMKKKLVTMTIMYRMKEDYDPDHKDWYWVKYSPDGKVAQKDGKPIGGRVKSCIQCHANAAGDDYVFTNDE